MRAETTRKLLSIHRICGLIVSLNVALFAITGVILIFADELNEALGVFPETAAATTGATPEVSLGRAIELARATQPSALPVWVARAKDRPHYAFVGLNATSNNFQDSKAVTIDLARGEVATSIDLDKLFTTTVLELHTQLLMGPAGSLLVGVIGIAFLVSLITGAVIYGPMMKRFEFGLLRRDRQLRTFMADLHKLLGVATFGWNVVVVLTGIFLTLGSVLLQLYANHELAALAAPHKDEPTVNDLRTVDAAIAEAERTSGRKLSFAALPGSMFASPAQYAVMLEGTKGLDARVATIALVDARNPRSVEHHQLPLYLRALLLSEPLHFGDYGGMPLKLLWALFSLVSLGLAVSGVWITVSARKQRKLRVGTLDAAEPAR